jgi:hypothetical protein
MSVDESQTVIQSFYLGARDDSTGALSSAWTMLVGTTPADVAVALSTVNVFHEPAGAAFAPFALKNTVTIPHANYWRVSALVRGDAGDLGRNIIGVCGTGATAGLWALAAEFHNGDNFVGINVLNVNILNIPTGALAGGVWFRIALECIGTTAKLYFNTTSNANPNSAPAVTDLTLFGSITLTTAQTPTGTLFPCFAMSNADAVTTTAISDFVIDFFAPPKLASGTGSGGLSSPDPSPYRNFKSIREAQLTYNNLVVGP